MNIAVKIDSVGETQCSGSSARPNSTAGMKPSR